MRCVDITRLKKSGHKLSHRCKERSTLKTNEVCDSSFKKKRDHKLLTKCKENALRKSLRHRLHGRGFICNRIGFDAVTPFVYTAPVEFVMHQSLETPTPWVPGKGRGFDIDPGQKASISLLPGAGAQVKRPYP